MSQKKEVGFLPAILLVAAIGMASAMDYSAALGQDGNSALGNRPWP